MSQEEETTDRTALLGTRVGCRCGDEAHSIISSAVSKGEQALGGTAIGERLRYNDYTTIDWLHDLVGTETCGMRRHD